MQSAGLRRRPKDGSAIELGRVDGPATRRAKLMDNDDPGWTGLELLDGENADREGPGVEPPKFTVNLGHPPAQRYNHIVPHFRQQLSKTDFNGLFDDIIRSMAPPALAKCLHVLARIALRRVYTSEETAELRGISNAANISLHLLVAFNALLDLLLGCTSGGCRVEADEKHSSSKVDHGSPTSRVLHFRTLDWGMDALRQIVVELDFVLYENGPIVATSLTYFGYVGVLTGVRSNLSLSLNFRPHHDRTTFRKRLDFRIHQLLVLLGLRQSISSVLRGYLLMPVDDVGGQMESEEDLPPAGGGPRMSRILRHLALSPSTAAYLVFCTPQKVYCIEKDHRTASVRSSHDFLTAYNHDVKDEGDSLRVKEAALDLAGGPVSGMENLVRYSTERKTHLDLLWHRAVNIRRRKYKRRTHAVSMEDVLHMVRDVEISNEETHYAVLMDPERGKILWRRAYPADESESV